MQKLIYEKERAFLSKTKKAHNILEDYSNLMSRKYYITLFTILQEKQTSFLTNFAHKKCAAEATHKNTSLQFIAK